MGRAVECSALCAAVWLSLGSACVGLNPDWKGAAESSGETGVETTAGDGDGDPTGDGDGDPTGDGDGDPTGDGDGDPVGDGDGDPVGEVGSVDVQIAASSDDAEESSQGEVITTSPDLEFVFDPEILGNDLVVGLRFASVGIPAGATITSASLEFVATGLTDTPTSLELVGHAHPDPAAFTTAFDDISSRPSTSASVAWPDVAVWTEQGQRYDSPDLSAIVQELVEDPQWAEGNAMVFITTGQGRRVAFSWDGSAGDAVRLHVGWLLP